MFTQSLIDNYTKLIKAPFMKFHIGFRFCLQLGICLLIGSSCDSLQTFFGTKVKALYQIVRFE